MDTTNTKPTAPASRWALAVELLERAARLIGVPTTPEELAAYAEAKRRYDAIEYSFQEERPRADGASERAECDVSRHDALRVQDAYRAT